MPKKDKSKDKSKTLPPPQDYLQPVNYQAQRSYDKMYDVSKESKRTSGISPGVAGMRLSAQPNVFVSAPRTAGASGAPRVAPLNYRAVKVSGGTIQGDAIAVNQLAGFHVNTTDAGPADPGIIITDPGDNPVENRLRVVQPGLHECSFTPLVTGQHNVSVCFAGMNVKGSPFKVCVVENVPLGRSHKKADRPSSERIATASDPSQRSKLHRRHTMQPPSMQPDSILEMLKPDLRARIQPCIISPTDFKKGRIIGAGEFGDVSEVRLQVRGSGSKMYAAKTLKRWDAGQLDEFFREADLMNNFKHPNVLPLQCIVIWESQPYILVPIMKHGSIKEYLERHKDGLEKTTLIDYTHQVSFGMEYVSDLKFVHRDLAARNCLLDENGLVKISDFGLARDNFKNNYVMLDRQKRLPIRWMAPEILTNWTFTTETDVWAYGVLMWEIFTYGGEPYGLADDAYLIPFLKAGNRLEKPEHATDELYMLMNACWDLDAGRRPNFASISQHLKHIMVKEGGHVRRYKNLE